jgi:hypothetical protein
MLRKIRDERHDFFPWGHNICCNAAHFVSYIFGIVLCIFLGGTLLRTYFFSFSFYFILLFLFYYSFFFLWGKSFEKHGLNLGFTQT